jgi:hypothetical protein
MAKTTIDLEATTVEVIGDASIAECDGVALTKALDHLRKVFGELGAMRYAIGVTDDGAIVLMPSTSIPLRELWLYRNPEALASVRRGLVEAGQRRLKSLGSFAQYADDRLEDE